MNDDDRIGSPRNWAEDSGRRGCYKCPMCGQESDTPLNNHQCPARGSYEAEQRLERKIKEENS